jgi:hypothetical protein
MVHVFRNKRPNSGNVPSWRGCAKLRKVVHGLRLVQTVVVDVQRAVAGGMGKYSCLISGAYTYGSDVWTIRPHLFFAKAFDPMYLHRAKARARVADVSGLARARAVRNEVASVLGVLESAVEVLANSRQLLSKLGLPAVADHCKAVQWLAESRCCLIEWQQAEAAKLVQAGWRRCVADPAFWVCRKRLHAEFAELISSFVAS